MLVVFSALKYEEYQKLLSQRKAIEESLRNSRSRYDSEVVDLKRVQKLFAEAQDVVTRYQPAQAAASLTA